MATLTHAQYNSPMPLYSTDNVQEVLNQVTQYPGRPHSAMSGSFDPNQSHVYRYLQSGGQLPPVHSARYEERPNNDPNPRYRGFVDPNVQSPSFKRLQYVTGIDSGTEDEISQEFHGPPQIHTDEVHVKQTGAAYAQPQSQESEGQPIALGYAPMGNAPPQQQQYQQYQQQQFTEQASGRPTWAEEPEGPPVAQRDPAAGESVAGPTFAQRIADAERPKVPPPVVPSWARFADRKNERWHQHTGQQSEAQQPPTIVQYYRPPQPSQQRQPQWTLDSSKAAQDKWQAHYAPYRFESGTAAAAVERPRSRSVEPGYAPGRRYGGPKEYFKPYIAPNLRFNYGDGFTPPTQPSYSPLSASRTYTTKQQDYGQYYDSQSAGATSPYQGGARTYASTTSQNYDVSGGTIGAPIGVGVQQPAPTGPSWTKESQYSRSAYESKSEGGTGSQQQAVALPWTGGQAGETQSQTLWQSELEAKRQRQLLEQEVKKRAASAGPPGRQVETTSTAVSSGGQQWQKRPVPSETRVTTVTSGGSGPRWQQAPGSETKSQSTGSYLDKDGKKVSFTKEVYTSSDPGKEFSMLTEQEKKILDEPLQPGVISRHITTKYYKKSTYTSTTTSSTSQTPPVTTTVMRQPIQSRPSSNAPGSTQF